MNSCSNDRIVIYICKAHLLNVTHDFLEKMIAPTVVFGCDLTLLASFVMLMPRYIHMIFV